MSTDNGQRTTDFVRFFLGAEELGDLGFWELGIEDLRDWVYGA